MKKDGLSAKEVQHMKPGKKRMEVPAGLPDQSKGLYLVVHPTGKKGWAFRYRWRGRTRNITFPKSYPDMSLAAARTEADEKIKLIERGVDPATVQAEEQKQEAPDMVKAVGEEWITRYVKPNTRTWPEVERIMKREVFIPWRDKYIGEIGKADVLRLLDAIVDRPAPVLANRVLSIFKRWFRWSVERGYIDASPVAGIRPPSTETTRDRVLTHEELSEIWNATPDIGFPFGDYFRFVILTGQRRNEVASMRWAEIDLESDAPLWTLPRESTKAARVHDVPLSSAAKELLEAAPRFEDDDDKEVGVYVFTTTSGKRPVSGYSKAKVLLDDAIVERRKKKSGQDREKPLARWTIHDLRRTMTTWMANSGVAPHVLAAILNHTPGSTMGITAVYARSRWTKEKRQALDQWAEYVTGLEAAQERKAAS